MAGLARLLRGAGLALLILTAGAARFPACAQPAADATYAIAYGDRIAVQVFIDGKGPFDFLLDTAATRTVIYEHARQRLELAADRNAPVAIFGLTGEVHVPSLRLDEIRLAGVRVAERPTVAVIPDTPSRQDEPDGVLGLDVLGRWFLVLDHAAGRARLYARAADAPAEVLAWPHVPLIRRKLRRFPYELWFVDAEFNRRPALALFDLGAGVTILNWRLGARLGLREGDFGYQHMPKEVEDVLGKSAPVVEATDLYVQIGRRDWSRTTALVADAPIFGLLDLAEDPGALLGPGLLKDESLALDFEGRRLYLAPATRPAPRSAQPLPGAKD